VIFDWDNTFASYMLGMDAKEHGYSALVQVVRSRTREGFVPNSAESVNKAAHSQPPVASKVLFELWKRHGDDWMVGLLFDDLLDWNNWFDANRRLPPLMIGCLGSQEGVMQDARFESGLDNSPMYDADACADSPHGRVCGAWNCSTSGGQETCGCFADEKMQLYDVGMASMHAMDAAALATLASAIGREDDAKMLRARAEGMAGLVEAHLWDAESGAYVNRMPDGRFNRHVSPTSFYPMLGAGASEGRVEQMVSHWLMRSDRFCISAAGDFENNTDGCYWGLPSIEASDPAFPALGYWRGYVWGPMAMLTYWGLQNYDHVPAASSGRRALCRQMNALMLAKWREARLVCENYHPARHHLGCSPKGLGTTGGMKFYHWGALTGFLSLLEYHYVNSSTSHAPPAGA